MAVEVIEEGELHKNYCWKPQCRVCKSKLLVRADDKDSVRRVRYSDQREPGASYDYLRCFCPVCEAPIRLDDWEDIPEVVQRRQLANVETVTA